MKYLLLCAAIMASACSQKETALSIALELDGHPAPPINQKTLEAHPASPDKDGRRSWPIATLLGPAMAEKSLAITVYGAEGRSITMPRPKDHTTEPLLILEKDGATSASMSGDQAPALAGPITRITVTSTDKEKVEERAQVTDIKPLAIKLDGQDAPEWSYDALMKLIAAKGVSRDTWSLRDAAASFVGPKARVVAVINAEEERMELPKSEWANSERTPAMRVNRQGQYKFTWSGGNPMTGGIAELRNVRVIELVTDK